MESKLPSPSAEAIAAALYAEITAKLKSLHNARKDYEQQRALWDSQAKKMEPTMKVKLDVGGTRFAATVAILQSQPGFFKELVAGRLDVPRDQDGCYFIDRDPGTMRYIMNHLRGQTYTVNQLDLQALLVDCEYYELYDLKGQLEGRGVKTPGHVTSKLLEMQSCNSEWREAQTMFLALENIFTLDSRQLQEDEDMLATEKKDAARLQQKILETVVENKIKLDVGGQIFATSLKTLTKEDNYFRAQFSGKFSLKPDEDGCFFIERDPFTFSHILNYLRSGAVPKFSSVEQGVLKSDCDYYILPELFKKYQATQPIPRRNAFGHY